MQTEILAQINKLLESSQKIAIILPEKLDMDIVCAGLALAKKVQLSGKSADLFSSCSVLPELLFLPQHQVISQSFKTGDGLVIRVNSGHALPSQLKYEKRGSDLYIYISTTEGHFIPSDVEVLPVEANYDLLIILGANSLAELGQLYSEHTELFFNTTKLVINNRLGQEYFATLTWVEPDIFSLCEVLASLLKDNPSDLSDDTIGTALLAGIISKTQSFRDPRTTPSTLALASVLIKANARHQDIIQHLFKTKPFNLLQLWGRALARVKYVRENILFTVLTKQDFEKTSTTTEQLPELLLETISMVDNHQLLVVAGELGESVEVVLAGPSHMNLKKLAILINPEAVVETQNLSENIMFVRFKISNTLASDLEKTISSLPLIGI